MSKQYNVMTLPGDGNAKEVVEQGVRVLEKAAQLHGFDVDVRESPLDSQYFIE